MNRKKITKRWQAIGAGLALVLVTASAGYGSVPSVDIGDADRAVEIARQARDRVEISSKGVKASSDVLFKEFAERTAELQKLLDTRMNLENAGLLTKGYPMGDARRANINGKILVEVGKLKEVCDKSLDGLLRSLENFDKAVSDSLVDSQATRSINSNYEIALDQYISQEKKRFERAAEAAQEALDSYRDNRDTNEQKRLLKQYERAKKRLRQIEQRRRIYEARIKVATMNQEVSGLIREKIRADGNDVSSRFRTVMTDLYNTFAKIIPVAESGGTGSPEVLANLGFNNIEGFKNTLDIVDGATAKLSKVLDEMVNDVMSGLGEIKVIDGQSFSAEVLSVEEEMEFLRKQRESWGG
jgi:tetratricopeptide (TPR) repeat protein